MISGMRLILLLLKYFILELIEFNWQFLFNSEQMNLKKPDFALLAKAGLLNLS